MSFSSRLPFPSHTLLCRSLVVSTFRPKNWRSCIWQWQFENPASLSLSLSLAHVPCADTGERYFKHRLPYISSGRNGCFEKTVRNIKLNKGLKEAERERRGGEGRNERTRVSAAKNKEKNEAEWTTHTHRVNVTEHGSPSSYCNAEVPTYLSRSLVLLLSAVLSYSPFRNCFRPRRVLYTTRARARSAVYLFWK